MLDHVGQRLGDEEVDAGLNRGRKPFDRDLEWRDRDRKPARQSLDGGTQPAIGEDRGMDSGCQLAQLVDPRPRLVGRQVEHLVRPLGILGPLRLGQLEIYDAVDEVLLGTVVEVAGHALARRVGGLDRSSLRFTGLGRPRLGHVAVAGRPLGLALLANVREGDHHPDAAWGSDRMRNGFGPSKAARLAVIHAGPAVAAAGLILAGTFAALIVSPLLSQPGFAVALGVLLAAFVMAWVLVPSLTTLLGRKAFWPGKTSRTANRPVVPELAGDEGVPTLRKPVPVKAGIPS
jgi:MMPL family